MNAAQRRRAQARRAARMCRLVRACGGDTMQARRVYNDLKRLGAHP